MGCWLLSEELAGLMGHFGLRNGPHLVDLWEVLRYLHRSETATGTYLRSKSLLPGELPVCRMNSRDFLSLILCSDGGGGELGLAEVLDALLQSNTSVAEYLRSLDLADHGTEIAKLTITQAISSMHV